MKTLFLILVVASFPALCKGGERGEQYLTETMIPLAQTFLSRITQTNAPPLETNQVKSFKVDFFDDRPGCTAAMRLTNGCVFRTYSENGKSEVNGFHRPIKTYYALENAPKEKVVAVNALNLQNKLNKDSALILAQKYFRLLGHHEDNFHAPEILQCYWSGEVGGKLPYYEITWYRKDVTAKELADNDSRAKLKTVVIEISGIDSSLISYSKGLLPINSDF